MVRAKVGSVCFRYLPNDFLGISLCVSFFIWWEIQGFNGGKEILTIGSDHGRIIVYWRQILNR